MDRCPSHCVDIIQKLPHQRDDQILATGISCNRKHHSSMEAAGIVPHPDVPADTQANTPFYSSLPSAACKTMVVNFRIKYVILDFVPRSKTRQCKTDCQELCALFLLCHLAASITFGLSAAIWSR